jgi:hypothetical protein
MINCGQGCGTACQFVRKVVARYTQGTEPAPMTQAAFRDFIATDRERWARVIRDGNIRVD